MSFNEPLVSIGGIPVDEQNFAWQITSGVQPYYGDIVVSDDDRASAIEALANPTYIEANIWGGVGLNPTNHVTKFEQVYILEPRKISDYQIQFQVADSRWAWRGKKVFKQWNKTRQQNLFGVINPGAASTDPAILRQDFDIFPTGRYLPWSIRGDGKPFTVYEMIEQVFQDLGISYQEDSEGRNKSYVLENISLNGVDVYQALSYLCSLTRMNISIGFDGKPYAYSVDIFDEQPVLSLGIAQALKVEPGIVARQDLSRIRPKKITVRFEKKQEVRIIATPASVETIENPDPSRTPISEQRLSNSGLSNSDFESRRVIGCINVIPVPLPLQIGSRRYNIGEFAAMDEYLVALGITDQLVRDNWFSDILAFQIDLALLGPDQVTLEGSLNAQQIAAAIKAHYRQTYQIDPYFIDQIERWEPRRCVVVDNYSKASPPSPAWIDYCLVPKGRTPKHVKSGLHSVRANNYLVDTYDKDRENPTPGTITVVNQPLGIFKLSLPYDKSMVIDRIIPSAVEPLPELTPAAANWLWNDTSLKEVHNFETLISVIWATDAALDSGGADKYYDVELDYFGQLGESNGPDILFLSKKDYARIPTPAKDAPTQNDEPVNETILRTIASAEAARIMNQFRDRVVGVVTLPGHQKIKVDGNIKSIIYEFTSEGGAATTVDMRKIPPTPSLEQNLSADAIAYLHRQVTRGGEANELS